MSEGIEDLLRHPAIWQTRNASRPCENALPSGFPVLDASLPGGGWPYAAVTEMLVGGDGAVALGLVARALSRVTREGRWTVCISPPHIPYAPAFRQRGVDVSRLLVAHGNDDREVLWAAEQALKAPACGAVLLWERDSRFPMRALRRLQLAAESSGGWGVLFRSPDAQKTPSAAALRLLIEPCSAGFSATMLKCRGGVPGKRIVIGNM